MSRKALVLSLNIDAALIPFSSGINPTFSAERELPDKVMFAIFKSAADAICSIRLVIAIESKLLFRCSPNTITPFFDSIKSSAILL